MNTIKTALLSLRMLLEAPNADDPQDAQVANMLINDPERFKAVAHDWAVRYAGATRSMDLPSEQQTATPGAAGAVDLTRYAKISSPGCLPWYLSWYLACG